VGIVNPVPGNRNMAITVPRFEQVSSVWHGFGTRALSQENLRVHAKEKGLDLVLLDQIHSDRIHVLEGFPKTQLSGDAMLTVAPGLLLTIKTADCLPVLILDERQKFIAAVHCGWRGTSQRLLQKVVVKMGDEFACEADDLTEDRAGVL
jgi:copper oxidase (laccase) domain-containing protein